MTIMAQILRFSVAILREVRKVAFPFSHTQTHGKCFDMFANGSDSPEITQPQILCTLNHLEK
jgi:hypothetical protein